MIAGLYSNENIPLPAVEAPRRLGHDVLTTQDAGKSHEAISDEEVLSFAAHKAHKSVFITTSAFAKGARDYVSQVSQKIVLIDGARHAELMIDHGVSVSTRVSYGIKRADDDYFADT